MVDRVALRPNRHRWHPSGCYTGALFRRNWRRDCMILFLYIELILGMQCNGGFQAPGLDLRGTVVAVGRQNLKSSGVDPRLTALTYSTHV
jgi:hypothetical protein